VDDSRKSPARQVDSRCGKVMGLGRVDRLIGDDAQLLPGPRSLDDPLREAATGGPAEDGGGAHDQHVRPFPEGALFAGQLGAPVDREWSRLVGLDVGLPAPSKTKFVEKCTNHASLRRHAAATMRGPSPLIA
jgi:hypothetical protein